MILLSVNGAILAYNMIMEDEMTKEETYDTHVYVEGRRDARQPVGMYTDEHSEICSIRFGNSFTLNVVSPQDLIQLALELDTFAKRAYELHYGDEHPRMIVMSEEMARIQEDMLARLLAFDPAIGDTEKPPGAASWKDPNDPINW